MWPYSNEAFLDRKRELHPCSLNNCRVRGLSLTGARHSSAQDHLFKCVSTKPSTKPGEASQALMAGVSTAPRATLSPVALSASSVTGSHSIERYLCVAAGPTHVRWVIHAQGLAMAASFQ